MTEQSEETDLRIEWGEAFMGCFGGTFDRKRNLVITPIYGAHGVAGYVIAIEGMTAKGLALFELWESSKGRLVAISPENAQKTIVITGEMAHFLPDRSKQKVLWNATLDLICAMRLPLRVGAKMPPDFFTLKSDYQLQKDQERHARWEGSSGNPDDQSR